MKTTFSILAALELTVTAAPALDRYDALSEIETRNNDRQIGPQREVSRYQILPELWDRAWGDDEKTTVRPTDPAAARTVVKRIMGARCDLFTNRYHRAPDDFEFYILWHRPACYIGRPVPRAITVAEAGRARRFANLCQSHNGSENVTRRAPESLPNRADKIFGAAQSTGQPPRS
jgi:hypothetical protein